MKTPVIVVGGGGHAGVLIDTLLLNRFPIIGFTDCDLQLQRKQIYGVPYLGDDSVISNYSPLDVQLVNAIGSTHSMMLRNQIYQAFKSKGYTFASVLHPSTIISRNAICLEGVQVMAGAIIQAGCQIGENTLINTRASVDHDCIVGSHVHIAPGATLSGGVHIEDQVHIGAGATIIEQTRIHNNSIVGAGSVVIRNVRANSKVYGVPAKEAKVL
jgi:sugar O-acyltransferase (sialic acid O-acetyltransferase NeuD family)